MSVRSSTMRWQGETDEHGDDKEDKREYGGDGLD